MNTTKGSPLGTNIKTTGKIDTKVLLDADGTVGAAYRADAIPRRPLERRELSNGDDGAGR